MANCFPLFLFTAAVAVIPLSGLSKEVPETAMAVTPPTPKTHLSFGLGYMQATAHEIVFGGASADGELSRLIWETEHALTIDAGLRYDWSSKLSIHADFSTSLIDDGNLVNYDWLGSSPQWTDRSIHPDTELDAYYRIDVGATWSFLKKDPWSLSASLGFRYVDISWTSRGGSYVYSTDPDFGLFRDDRGEFPSGEKGISYRQKIPGFYLGPQLRWSSGRLSILTVPIVGITVGATDRDRHWNRNLLFDETFDPQVFYGAQVAVSFALTPTLRLFADARYDHYELMKGSMRVTDLSTKQVQNFPGDAAGLRFGSWQFRTGVEFRF